MGAANVSYTAANDQPNGGCAPFRSLDLQPTGEVVKDSPGRLYGYHLSNNGAAKAFVKLYDKATAPDENDTPKLTLELPAGGTVPLSVGPGIAFTAGISVRGTTGAADNDTGAPSSNDLVVNLFYA
jgi:hypothetical protein